MATSRNEREFMKEQKTGKLRSIIVYAFLLIVILVLGFIVPQLAILPGAHAAIEKDKIQQSKDNSVNALNPKGRADSSALRQHAFENYSGAGRVIQTGAHRMSLNMSPDVLADNPCDFKVEVPDELLRPLPADEDGIFHTFRVVVNNNSQGCQQAIWKAETPDDEWIILPDLAQSGTREVNFKVKANDAGKEISGIINIVVGGNAVTSFTISHLGKPCTLQVSVPPGSPLDNTIVSVPPESGTVPVKVETLNFCSWTANAESITPGQPLWVSPKAPSVPPQSATINFEFEANPTPAPRSVLITIQLQLNLGQIITKTVQINQSPLVCKYEVDPGPENVPATGKITRSFMVKTQANCPWTATITTDPPTPDGELPWVHLAVERGTGPKEVEYLVEPNPTEVRRKATITVEGKPHVVDQAKGSPPPANCSYDIKPAELPVSGAQGSGEFTVETQPGCQWEVTITTDPPTPPGQAWVKPEQTRGVDTTTVKYTVERNQTTLARRATITIKNTGKTHIIKQAAGDPNTPVCSYTLSKMDVRLQSEGGSESFIVTTSPTCTWTVEPDTGVTITSPTGQQTNSGTVNFTVGRNSSTSDRRLIITIKGEGEDRIFTINQDPSCTFTLVPLTAFIGERGGEGGENTTGFFAFNVQTSDSCKWKASAEKKGKSWIHIVSGSESNTGPGTVSYSVLENKNVEVPSDERCGEIPGQRCGEIQVENATFQITQTPTLDCAHSIPQPMSIKFGQTVNGRLGSGDCTSQRGSAFFADRYKFDAKAGQRVAISVSSSSTGFDPFITLIRPDGKEDGNDDGAGFRNARIPRLPGKQEFKELTEDGTYIVEVASFKTSQDGNYAILITTDKSSKPTILGAVEDRKTLIVTGENFEQGAVLFMNGNELKDTRNDTFKPSTALISLKGAAKAKKELKNNPCVKLQVKNKDEMSDVFIFKDCKLTN